jgi:hypothetical protein
VAYLNRITIDVVSKEQLSESRLEHLSREATNFVHVVLVEPEDEVHVELDKHYNYHLHDNTTGESYCEFCVHTNAQDRLSGDQLVQQNAG